MAIFCRAAVDSSHSTRKNAIIAVAKSAKAIFQAPHVVPPPKRLTRLMIIG
jgi:hypothetical protein